MDTAKANGRLFSGLKFYIRLSSDAEYDIMKSLITSNGGNVINYLIDMVTHVISDLPEHPDVQQAIDIFEKIVVKPAWITLSLARQTRLPVEEFSPVRPKLFASVVVCPSSLAAEDVETIWAIVTYFGGSFKAALDSSVTHLVVAGPSGRKYTEALKHPNKIKVVTPDWVTDSVKNMSLCDEGIYHPSLLIVPKAEVSKRVQKSSPLNQAISPPPNQSPVKTVFPLNQDKYYTFDSSIKLPYNLCVFGCVFYFTGFDEKTRPDNMTFTCEQLRHFETNIRNHGGRLVAKYDATKVTHVIVDTQAHPIVPLARADGKRIVNIYWLEDVILSGKLRLPDKALHFPRSALISFLPPETLYQLPNPSNLITFRGEKIAVSGFSPVQVSILREMILQIGATFTIGFSAMNTLLIANNQSSEKCERALRWLIPIVSAHWLVDVFLGINDAHKRPFGGFNTRHKQLYHENPFQLDRAAMRHLLAGWNVPIKLDHTLLAAKVNASNVLGTITNRRI